MNKPFVVCASRTIRLCAAVSAQGAAAAQVVFSNQTSFSGVAVSHVLPANWPSIACSRSGPMGARRA